MNICIGVDVGAVGVKAALLLPQDQVESLVWRIGDRPVLRVLDVRLEEAAQGSVAPPSELSAL